MSNYNTQIQSNNTDLQAILKTIQELPAGNKKYTELWVFTMQDDSIKTQAVNILIPQASVSNLED